MNYLSSSFSLQMLPQGGEVEITPLNDISIHEWMDECRIGHEGTAKVLSAKFGVRIDVDRHPITLRIGDEMLVAQPTNNRLAVGTELEEPELAYFLVTVKAPHKCKTLTQYWDDELEIELNHRKGRPVK